ncbi:hypothetical protein K438DRAFT_1689322 [Mycena galopus ATCC 62051]|nr:hypothetical protein K438DRAFT_1689322 [Mycena galopus ATCC 62051]
MKKGFLTGSQAKAKLTKDTDSIAARSTGSNSKPKIIERFHGVLENTDRPEGYEATPRIAEEVAANAPLEGLPENMLLYTSQPSKLMSATPANSPDGWTECMMYPDAKAFILATPGFPAPILRPSSLKYRLTPIPDKGQGLVSTAQLRACDLILSERPLTMTLTASGIPIRFPKAFTAREKYLAAIYEWEQNLKLMFDRLHPDYQAAFMALANSHKHDGSGPILGVIRTNGLGLVLPVGKYTVEEQETLYKGRYTAVCKEISRANHSCSPNTTAHFDIVTFSYQLYAVRNIAQGEELTIAYAGLSLPAEIRQSKLEPYGFRCTCSACCAPSTSNIQRATALTMQIANIDDGLVKLALIEENGLQACDEYCDALKTVMDLYIALGDAENGSMYAKKLANRRWSDLANVAKLYTTPLAIESHRCGEAEIKVEGHEIPILRI